MTACPNCGRPTLRTKDWACQWCGYPLISRAYKVIDKTYKELQEERKLAARMPADTGMDTETPEAPENEEEPVFEPEPEVTQKKQPEQKQKFSLFGKPRPAHQPQPEASREPEDEPAPPPEPLPPPSTPKPAPPPVMQPQPEPLPVEEPEYPKAPEIAPSAEIVQKPEYPMPAIVPEEKPAEPVPPPAAAAPPPPAPEPAYTKPEIVIEPQSSHVSSVKADEIQNGSEISSDDLDALFRADKSGTNMKLNGKTIVLKGSVEKVFIRDHLDIRYIVVTGKKKLVWSSRCTFNKEDASKASRLNEGDSVAVKGKYDGYGKNVIFKDCQIV